MEISGKSAQMTSGHSTFLLEEPRASRSAPRESAEEWMIRVANWQGTFVQLLGDCAPAGFYGRTFPESFSIPRASTPWSECSQTFRNSGMAWRGECLTLNLPEWNHTLLPSPKDDGVCSLLDILETGDLPSRYYLSPKACAGILRRAEKRRKRIDRRWKRR